MNVDDVDSEDDMFWWENNRRSLNKEEENPNPDDTFLVAVLEFSWGECVCCEVVVEKWEKDKLLTIDSFKKQYQNIGILELGGLYQVSFWGRYATKAIAEAARIQVATIVKEIWEQQMVVEIESLPFNGLGPKRGSRAILFRGTLEECLGWYDQNKESYPYYLSLPTEFLTIADEMQRFSELTLEEKIQEWQCAEDLEKERDNQSRQQRKDTTAYEDIQF